MGECVSTFCYSLRQPHPACGFCSLLCSEVEFRPFSGSFPSNMTRMHLALLIMESLYRGSYIVANAQAVLVKQWNLPSLSPKGKVRQGKCSALLKAKFHPVLLMVSTGTIVSSLLCWKRLCCVGLILSVLDDIQKFAGGTGWTFYKPRNLFLYIVGFWLGLEHNLLHSQSCHKGRYSEH